MADIGGLVLGEAHLQARRPSLALLFDKFAGRFDGLDDVLAGAFGYFQSDRGLTIDAGIGLAVLEGAPDRGDVAKSDDGVGADLYGHLQDVLDRLEQPGDLNGKAAAAGVESASGDEQVGAAELTQQQARVKFIGIDEGGVDDDFDSFVAVAANIDTQDAGYAFETVAGLAGDAHQRAFRHIAGKCYDEDRK